ncbi:MAG: ComEC family competence protein, partial [Alphaproteobacteria bacterium]|nr:ComEC family competence protein [Alphaproteobacteria bacterium]
EVTIEELPTAETPQKISVSLRKPMEELQIGDEIRFKAMLFAPPTPVMPGAYDFARQFYFDRIGAVGFAPKPPEIIVHTPPSHFSAWLNGLRKSINDRIVTPMSPEAGPVAAAMMVGEMTAVPKQVGDDMRDAGIYHVLSISGLHMSIAVALVYISMRFLLALYPPLSMRLPAKKISAFVGLLSAVAYLLLAGYPVPAIRSFVMVACVMVAVMLDRRGVSLYSLAWSAVLILIFQPEAMLGASFQLSYAATIGIVAFYERFSHMLYANDGSFIRRIRVHFWGLILTSLVAALATTPLVIYHFNRFTLWGIAANMLMMPLASFWIMPAAVLAFLAMPFGLEHWPLIWLNEGIEWMLAGARYV